MNYEQKYKEALGWMQSLYDGLHGPTKEEAEHYFPELKESGDEVIRKRLIKAFGSMVKEQWGGIAIEDILAWLEKQGEHKPYGQRKKCENCQFNYAGECKGYCALKRNEQKPILDFKASDWYVSKVDGKIHNIYHSVDKVEPKFKVYDWITGIDDEGKVFTYKIVDFWGDKVRLVDLDEYFTLYPKSELNNYRLWTINDAKDGDLIYVSTETKSFHAIFHKFENGIIYFHCNLCGDFAQGGYEPSGDVKSVNPLLKEHYQRFFQKMKQAGYEWDQKEKKLIKMKEPKFKVGDWITDGCVGGQITSIEENYPCYKISDFMGINTSIPFTIQDNYHLWTINDAKDGDVLVDSDSKDSIIILYKGIYKEQSILAHCGWNGYNLFKINGLGYGGLDNTNYLPATKEQRNLLFEKMKEAGYEWDAEKKVLSKRDMEILPEAKMQAYIKYCNDKSPSNIFCDKCNKAVTIEREYPYFYDKDENDVYFASICPECGELFITKE